MEQLLNTFRAKIAELDRELSPSSAMIASHNWIVVDEFGPMKFHLTPEGNKYRAMCIGHGSSNRVNRFTKKVAQTLATACEARAVFWKDAAQEELEQLRGHLKTIENAIV